MIISIIITVYIMINVLCLKYAQTRAKPESATLITLDFHLGLVVIW